MILFTATIGGLQDANSGTHLDGQVFEENKMLTLPKFNSSPLKNDGWKTTFLLGWYIFRGYVKLPGGKGLAPNSV